MDWVLNGSYLVFCSSWEKDVLLKFQGTGNYEMDYKNVK